MWKKTIALFLLGIALAGCGNDDNGAIGDNNDRMTPDVHEETNDDANPGIPEVGDITTDGDGVENNDDGGVNGNNGTNGAGDNGEIDGNVEEPGTDAMNENKDGNGLNRNRS